MGSSEPVVEPPWRRSWRVTWWRQVLFVFSSLAVAVPFSATAAGVAAFHGGLADGLGAGATGLLWWWALLGSQAVAFSLMCGVWVDHLMAPYGARVAIWTYVCARVAFGLPVVFAALLLSGGLLVSGYEGGVESIFGLFFVLPAFGILDSVVTVLSFQAMSGAHAKPPAPLEVSEPTPLD